MTKTFTFLCENDNGEWIDTLFVDNSANADCREWRVSRNTITGETYGTLLRSEEPDGDFEFSVTLPRKMVNKLMEAL